MTPFIAIVLALASLSTGSMQGPTKTTKIRDANTFDRYVRRLPEANRIVIRAMGSTKSCFKAEGAATPDEKSCVFVPSTLSSLEVSGKEAKQLWRRWRGLRMGNGAGCFAPGYFLDFFAGEELLLSAHVCFHCCNVEIPNSGIWSICGNKEAFERFQALVSGYLPHPEAEREQ